MVIVGSAARCKECNMLVLSRKVDEEIVIDGGIRIKIVRIRGNQVRLGISAPEDVSIVREEMVDSPSSPDSTPRRTRPANCC